MPTLLDFRRRIRSVKNTQQITRAMKFVAAARLRRAQEKIFAARPYAREMLVLLRSAMARVEDPTHPLMVRRPEERVLLLVVSSDRGLCGAFNANVIRRAVEFLREHKEKATEVIPIGKKARDALSKRKEKFVAEYINVSARVEFSRAREIAAQVVECYTAAHTDAVYALYNEFRSVLTQRLTLEKLLPIDPARWDVAQTEAFGEGEPRRPGTDSVTLVDYLYEQPPAHIFSRLLPRFVETQVFRAMLESSAAEHAARMTAMDSATNNAAELMDQLTLHMNKVRQATITKEIIEVVSGAAWTA
ncbi:MAG TPA: ATP synthase F1 subunit gamma [Candidatus Acidoferrales bacterium]|nr:ATP synthase F1 subunit gamma [Candidatus Acidoferrales bacterium]